LTAQTRDMKTFDGNAIEVLVGTGTTLYVANYPPTADEAYIRDLFKEVSSTTTESFKRAYLTSGHSMVRLWTFASQASSSIHTVVSATCNLDLLAKQGMQHPSKAER
jgi:hypothetical protein